MTGTPPDQEWWQDSVVYQVYLRSFRDGSGDGIGDLRGLRQGLSAIADLGCDAIWLNPCYVSPQRDHGYDIADYRSIDPVYGTSEEFDALVRDAHRLGLRVVMDMVANHCSADHPWFREALAAGPGSPQRRRFLFRDGRGNDGEEPPNNWESVFGGSAWTRVNERGGRPGQWYLHSFDPSQPDLNWRDPSVVEDFDDILRFWFDRGVDGFRVDVAHGMIKEQGLPDFPRSPDTGRYDTSAMWDQPEVHDIYRRWRSIGDTYAPRRYFVGEVWVSSDSGLEEYLRPDELHQAFVFDLLVQPWDGRRLMEAIDAGLSRSPAGGTPAWALENHDVHRAVTRYGQTQARERPDPSDMIAAARREGPVDLRLGTRRARAAAGLLLALPGAVYLYQGEELGLPEVLDLPDECRTDPIWRRSGGAQRGRDGCRVPLPWTGEPGAYGFSTGPGVEAWLPQPAAFAPLARALQENDQRSMLALHRQLSRLRSEWLAGAQWRGWAAEAAGGLVAFRRGPIICAVNTSDSAAGIPSSWGIRACLVNTADVPDTQTIAPDSTSWLVPGDADITACGGSPRRRPHRNTDTEEHHQGGKP